MRNMGRCIALALLVTFLFIIVGAVEESGLLALIADWILDSGYLIFSIGEGYPKEGIWLFGI